MKKKEKMEIVAKYKNKSLMRIDYNKGLSIDSTRLKKLGSLLYLLDELGNYEVTLTKLGLNFLEEYYGLDNVADMILKEIERGYEFKFSTREDIIGWLKAEAEGKRYKMRLVDSEKNELS